MLTRLPKRFWLPAAALGALLSVGAASGAESAVDPLALLETHCVRCHGGEKTKAGLDMTSREALLRGGDSGAVVVPGQPAKSLFHQMLTHEKDPGMPYKEKKLPEAAIKTFAAWIGNGVPYARAVDKTAGASAAKSDSPFTDSERNHWAFQPVKRPEPPAVKREAWVQSPIDRFILAQLEAKNLRPAPPATREQLIRRVTLDLIGLPPTPREIDDFVNDTSPKAYEKLVERLLASPHYGERWGRHWLDLARFAETDGFEHDAVRPHSWRYRDYVIRAFNADKPYDRFIREQLAGDELFPGDNEALIATGFNLLGPDMVDSSDQMLRRHLTLNDMTDTAGLAFLGLTIGCARCHDHKFEPLSQKDYYSLQAFFTPVAFQRELPVPTPQQKALYDERMAALERSEAMQALKELEAPYRQKIFEQKLGKLSPEAQEAHRTPAEQRTTDQANLALETAAMVEVNEKEISKLMSAADRQRHGELKTELKKLPQPPELPRTMALQNTNASPRTFVLIRGELSNRGEEVTPGFPGVVAEKWPVKAETSRRSALANWVASPENPLTVRVMVNRIWQHHFGRGIVPTPSDFGLRGQPPSHPELLDWLAAEFVARGWSIKQMHRLILLSSTYQQSALAAPDTLQRDPENLLFSRRQRTRLEGEVIRDSLLAISGLLNLKMGGAGVFPPIPKDLFQGAKGWTASSDKQDHQRRSIYIFARRNLRFPFLEVFDAPDSNLSCPERGRSTTAPQSLTLLNAEEVVAATEATTARLEKEAATDEERVTVLYRLALGRRPTAKELELSREFLKASPMTELCRAMFNLNAFVYVE
ncbi:MAG: PSD1 and planctomycete cytochrome C domain-containing protein [Verrucomicrobiota bacterium]